MIGNNSPFKTGKGFFFFIFYSNDKRQIIKTTSTVESLCATTSRKRPPTYPKHQNFHSESPSLLQRLHCPFLENEWENGERMGSDSGSNATHATPDFFSFLVLRLLKVSVTFTKGKRPRQKCDFKISRLPLHTKIFPNSQK